MGRVTDDPEMAWVNPARLASLPLRRQIGPHPRRYASPLEARAFCTGVYTMQDIVDDPGVRHSTLSRAVGRL